MSFIAYDITFLVLFALAVTLFLYQRRHNLKREGLMYLYRTKLGIRLIEYTSRKYASLLRPLQYLVITSGYVLMIAMVWLLFMTLRVYLQQPASSPLAKIPAVFPLIPYFPQLFHLESLFPPFYFTYFLIAIAIVAISHEFAHGIFARLNKVKIHSTGFAFLGPFLGAFVEQDEKQMQRAPKVAQLAILAAGTFANVLMFALFGVLLIIFFAAAFSPSGFIFTDYATSIVNVSDVRIGGVPFAAITETIPQQSLVPVQVKNATYLATPAYINYSKSNNLSILLVYDDSPALKAGLRGAITELGSMQIHSYADMKQALVNHKPGDTISIKTINESKGSTSYTITLGEREGRAYLGISSAQSQPRRTLFGRIYGFFASIKDPQIYYTSPLGDLGVFIYDLLWWVVIINLLVALFNMFPAGILDGGRFLMLTIWGITGKKKWGENILKLMTWMLLLFIFVMMLKWFFNIF